jgi:hypothetical protein
MKRELSAALGGHRACRLNLDADVLQTIQMSPAPPRPRTRSMSPWSLLAGSDGPTWSRIKLVDSTDAAAVLESRFPFRRRPPRESTRRDTPLSNRLQAEGLNVTFGYDTQIIDA